MKWDAGSVRNMGSGFVISGDGLVVTNAHVVERYADGAVVITLDGGEKLKVCAAVCFQFVVDSYAHTYGR